MNFVVTVLAHISVATLAPLYLIARVTRIACRSWCHLFIIL